MVTNTCVQVSWRYDGGVCSKLLQGQVISCCVVEQSRFSWTHQRVLTWSFVCVQVVVLLLTEIAPKSIAVHNAAAVANFVVSASSYVNQPVSSGSLVSDCFDDLQPSMHVTATWLESHPWTAAHCAGFAKASQKAMA
jgi:hypothetical protein